MMCKKKKQPKIEESIYEKRIPTSGIVFLRHKWGKLGQLNENNMFSNIL